jgi:hypothetical protein
LLLSAALGASVGLNACVSTGDTAGGGDAISGTVRSAAGPEAGVWVIAETTDLPTKFAKVVVTDDQGRYVIPELPKANYSVWVRGYGLVDSARERAAPGAQLNLTAIIAPNERAAAHYYPGMYWYSMINIPAPNEFPGTAANGISSNMKQQVYWMDLLKNSCQSCHALGSQGMREVPPMFGTGISAWSRRTQSGQAMNNMALGLGHMGAERALREFSNWTDRIAGGETPIAKPERPKGLERNVVVSMWDFSSPKHYLHDGISTDRDNPTVNAHGPIYGAPEESTDSIPVLDPRTHTASVIRHPVNNPKTPSSLGLPLSRSAYWGDEKIWDGHSSIHNTMLDRDGRVWFTARIRPASNPDFCKKGSSHPSAKVFPLDASPRHVSVYDPKSKAWRFVDTCFATHHLYFAPDSNRTLWLSQGGPQSGVVGWVNTKRFLETGDSAGSQGWTPIIVDTNGDGKRGEYTEPNQPFDPKKDRRVQAAFYGVMPHPTDGSVWGQSMDVGFSRMDQRAYLVRVNSTPNVTPNFSETALAEIYQSPEGTYGMRGLDIDSRGLVWTALASGHVASFDRAKCKGPLNGPTSVDGKHCPEGWTLYRMPGPQFKGQPASGSANHAYYVWVDRHNTLGLGRDVPIASTNGGESLLAIVNGQTVDLRVPYPLGFFTKLVDGRIDDPNAGWKGRGLWTMSGTRAVFHNEGGTSNYPKVYKMQVRPDPLAR